MAFCTVISTAFFVFAQNLMSIFVTDYEIIMIGANYLKIEGAFYNGIGIWISIPIGWFLADLFSVIYYLKNKPKI